jgi:hypothetical protein
MIYKNTRKKKDCSLVCLKLDADQFYGIPLDEAIESIKEMTRSLIEPVLFVEMYEVIVEGFVKLTPAQIQRAKRKQDQARAAAKAKIDKKRQEEIEQLKKLSKKYPDALA